MGDQAERGKIRKFREDLRPPIPPRPATAYDIVIVSDRHRGVFNACSARQRRVIDALNAEIPCRVLIHNGDTDDMERKALRNRWGVPEDDKCYYDSVNAAGARGVENIFIRGNHDEPLRKLEGQTRHGIRYEEKVAFTTARGQDVAVLHGDQFDPGLVHLTNLARGGLPPALAPVTAFIKKRLPRLARAAPEALRRAVAFGDMVHTGIVALSGWTSRALHHCVGVDWNFYGAAMTGLEILSGKRQAFEDRAVKYALDHGHDVIITGHTHDPYIKTIKKGDLIGSFNKAGGVAPRIAERDVTFINVGDGVESHTFLGVTKEGDFHLRWWPDFIREVGPERRGVKEYNRKSQRAKTETQIADVHETCFGVPPSTPAPRSLFRPGSPSAGP